jgi:ABC-type nitrate/sulfonate/bicarbonate transport system permease component
VSGVLLALQALVLIGVLDGRYLPLPSQVAVGIFQLLARPSLWANAAATWHAALLGFAVGLAIAIPAGLIAGGNMVVWHALRPVVEFLRPLPTVAMIPLVVLLWGPSTFSKAFLVCFTTLWPVFIQTAYSVRDTNPTAIETARSFGLGGFAIARRIVLPSALPGIATAVRIQASIALLVTITSEVALGGGGGLGILVFQLDQAGDYVGMYALLVLIGAQGMFIGSLLAWAERRLMPWHVGHREEQS